MPLLKPSIFLLLAVFIGQEALAGPSARKKRRTKATHSTTVTYQSDGSYVEETTSFYEPQLQPQQRSSAYERRGKIVALSVMPIGASVALYGNSHVLLGVKYQKPFLTLGAPYQPDDSSLITVYADMFLLNSFYITGGFGQRELSYSGVELADKLLVSLNPDGRKRNVSYKDNGFDVGLGNRWQWQHFFIGLQWVSAYFKVTEPEAEVDFRGDEGTLTNDKLAEEEERDEMTNPSLTTSLHIGLSF